MSSNYEMSVMESMFDAEQTTNNLLKAVCVNVNSNVKTVDQAAMLENKLSEEAARFNECLTKMSNSIRKCERGEISRDEMIAECTPCVAALKEKCVALSLANVKTTGDDITEEEIAMLREYIVGCKDIVAARKKELQDCACAANEGVLSALSNYDPATEASMSKEIRKGVEAKTAAQLYKQAKKLYGLGSKEKALETLKKAQGLYEKCLEKAKSEAKMYTTERSIKSSAPGLSVKDKFTKDVTDNTSFAKIIAYFEDRIDACKALEMQWNNKAGKSTYKETKQQLKEERRQARAEKKANKKGGNDEMREDRAVESFIASMESFMDSVELDLAVEAAMEAEGESDDGKSASGIGTRLRAAFAKLRKAKKEGNDAEARDAAREVQSATDDLEKAEKEADTPEKKAKLSKAAKVGLAAAAAAAAAVGLTIAAKKASQSAKSAGERGFEISRTTATLAKLSDAVASAKSSAVGAATNMSRQLNEKNERNKQYKQNKQLAKQFTTTGFGKIKGAKVEESFLSSLAFGLEGVTVDDEDIDDDEIDTMDGKEFDADSEFVDEAPESYLNDMVLESEIAIMLAEDGIDDSDLE